MDGRLYPKRPQSRWQLIETAPKDGSKVDLCYPPPLGRVINCFWNVRYGGWNWRAPILAHDGAPLPEAKWALSSYDHLEPTHWMPTPAMPWEEGQP
jgi:hypothetical protein